MVVTLTFLACTNNPDLNKLSTKYKADKVIIVSCYRCACIDEELNEIFATDSNLIKDYTILADTNCYKKSQRKFDVSFIAQAAIDSLYQENYNLLIFNPTKNGGKVVITKTSDVKKIKQLL